MGARYDVAIGELGRWNKMLARGFRFDGAFIWNDQAYRNGPFFSPAAYRELSSRYRRASANLFTTTACR